MKSFKNTLAQAVAGLIAFLFSTTIQAQELDKAQVQGFIESKEFVFKAQTVLPMSGTTRQLTSEYDVRFLGDSIVSFLPYFGRAYNATYGSEAGGINFTSTKFDYKVKPRKKGGWDITVKPQDNKEIQEMNFTIGATGYASLRVTSTNRQPISFNGQIVQR